MKNNASALLARRLKILRESRDVSASDLAKAIGVSPNSIWNIEAGRSFPTQETLTAIADHLKCSVAYLFSNDYEAKVLKDTSLGEALQDILSTIEIEEKEWQFEIGQLERNLIQPLNDKLEATQKHAADNFELIFSELLRYNRRLEAAEASLGLVEKKKPAK